MPGSVNWELYAVGGHIITDSQKPSASYRHLKGA